MKRGSERERRLVELAVDELLVLEPGIENCASLGIYDDYGLTERVKQ
jgi:hypothetical protein